MNLFEMQEMETEQDEFDGEVGHGGGGGGSQVSLLLCNSSFSTVLCL